MNVVSMSSDNWNAYILRCSDGTYYTGATNDIVKRLMTHQNGKGAKYTRARLPVDLMWVSQSLEKRAALKEERRIKSLGRAGKEALISSLHSERIIRGLT